MPSSNAMAQGVKSKKKFGEPKKATAKQTLATNFKSSEFVQQSDEEDDEELDEDSDSESDVDSFPDRAVPNGPDTNGKTPSASESSSSQESRDSSEEESGSEESDEAEARIIQEPLKSVKFVLSMSSPA